VSIDTRADVGRLCAWRSDEVELVEYGIDVCAEATGTIATLANIWCSGKSRNLPRSIMNTQGRISTQPAGMRYVIVWERK
jgi:hypothetical protein